MNVTRFGQFRKNERQRITRRVWLMIKVRGTKQQKRWAKDPDNLEMLVSELFAQFVVQDVQPTEIGDGRIMDQILRFFQFILDNWDKIGPIIGMSKNDLAKVVGDN